MVKPTDGSDEIRNTTFLRLHLHLQAQFLHGSRRRRSNGGDVTIRKSTDGPFPSHEVAEVAHAGGAGEDEQADGAINKCLRQLSGGRIRGPILVGDDATHAGPAGRELFVEYCATDR